MPDVELARGSEHSGCCRAVCGHLVTAAAMSMPQGEPCPSCSAIRESVEAQPEASSWSTSVRRVLGAWASPGLRA